ncbi:MAG: hotdog fold thioesterase [Gammaproteobacteria bacterium]|nr:hotdog fold thioesterase [Gammaproteobacteria bacterium]
MGVSIWYGEPTVEQANDVVPGTMMGHLGIEFTEIGDRYICASMPVDERTKQPMGLLHGGASVVLAETLGSSGCMLTLNPDTHFCVGLEINANHIRSARSGRVYGRSEPVHLGRSTQVWSIRIEDKQQRLVCISRITMSVLEKRV